MEYKRFRVRQGGTLRRQSRLIQQAAPHLIVIVPHTWQAPRQLPPLPGELLAVAQGAVVEPRTDQRCQPTQSDAIPLADPVGLRRADRRQKLAGLGFFMLAEDAEEAVDADKLSAGLHELGEQVV